MNVKHKVLLDELKEGMRDNLRRELRGVTAGESGILEREFGVGIWSGNLEWEY
jgi:hypothetical protein